MTQEQLEGLNQWPYAWMSVVAGIVFFFGWLRRQEGTEAIIVAFKFIAQFFGGPRFSTKEIAAIRSLSFSLSRKLMESHGLRVNAIAIHNGGGDITKAGPRFITVYDSQARNVKVDSAEAWHRVPLSPQYEKDVVDRLLVKSSDKDLEFVPFELKTKDLDDNNYLKAHYQTDSITSSIVCLAKVTRTDIWFVSINYQDLNHPPLGEGATEEEIKKNERHEWRRAIAFSTAQRMAHLLADLSNSLPSPQKIPAPYSG